MTADESVGRFSFGRRSGRYAPRRVERAEAIVLDHVMRPLGLQPERVWLTDVLPFFFVHPGKGTQGAAMSDRYDPFAATNGLLPRDLPARPTTSALIRRAVAEEGNRLRSEIRDSGAPLVITLGNEALAVARQLLDDDLLTREPYGQRYEVRLGDLALEVLPLVHPGQRAKTWTSAHDGWVAEMNAQTETTPR